ncbi:MAG: hypothetical protein ABIC95_07485 [archaeon]
MSYGKNKMSILLLAVVGIFALMAFSTVALPVEMVKVEVDDTTVQQTLNNFVLAKEKGDEIEVQIVFKSTEDLSNVQIEAVMRGYDHDDLIEDITDAFDMKANVTYDKKLNLKLPIRMDKDRYTLRIRVEDRGGETSQFEYHLQIEAENHELYLKDVVFNPEGYVKAGRALLSTVRVKNVGEQDEEGIKVRVAIPALGVSASDYIDEIEEGESTTSEELYMRIPPCADAGEYDVKVTVEYDDGDETITKLAQITVLEGDACEVPGKQDQKDDEPAVEKTVMAVGVSGQDVVAGAGGTVFPVAVTNQGSSARTYALSVDVPGAWASYQVSPSNVAVVKSGETVTMFVYLSAKDDAPAGENMFSLTLSSDGQILKQVPLKVSVSEGAEESSEFSWDNVTKALQIGLIVLVVLLVILGLIIGFQKLKGGDDEDGDESEKTYY